MKLQCQIEVNNRNLKDLNIRSNSKYIKSTLALGKEAKDKTEFFILHFSTVNKSGTKYRVKNIKQVFAKFINEGKSTIRFDDPPHDLCIKSDAVQLKCFMRLLKSCISGDAKALQTAAPLTSLSFIAKDNAPTKLVIRDRSEFPSKGLPRTLETLCLSGLKLCNFRRDILLLKRLTVLDLSNNEVEKLPAEFGRLPCLKELYLANNQLGSKEIVDWKWLLEPQIIKTLKLLDLSGNKLKYLPKAIGKLALITLKLDNNQLDQLPSTLGRISTLKYLSISGNQLQILPGSLLQCKLEHIDLSNNNFQRTLDPTSDVPKRKPAWEFYIGSLVNLAARVVLKHKFYYAPNIIPFTLVHFLDNANICVCGALTVTESTSLNRMYELKSIFRSVTCDSSRGSVPFECFFCSSNCLKRFLMYRHGQDRHIIVP